MVITRSWLAACLLKGDGLGRSEGLGTLPNSAGAELVESIVAW
jgi:hypothetical protein